MRTFRTLFCALLVAAAAFAQPMAALAATAGFAADISATINGKYYSVNDLGSVAFSVDQVGLTQLTPGTGTGKADKVFSDTRTIAASSSENLDLAGVLTDPFGGTLTMVKVKAIYVKASCANTNDVQIGGAASNTFLFLGDATDIIAVKPCGFQLITNPTGWTVTAATGDILKVANSSSGTGVTYDIIIVGTSA